MKATDGFYGCTHLSLFLPPICFNKKFSHIAGSVHLYPFNVQDPKGPFRSAKGYIHDVKMSITNKMIINGVKRNCTLNNLKYFNSVDSTCIDCMHAVLEGVIKSLFNYWFNGKINASYSY
jgi:hypothetical protein